VDIPDDLDAKFSLRLERLTVVCYVDVCDVWRRSIDREAAFFYTLSGCRLESVGRYSSVSPWCVARVFGTTTVRIGRN